MNVVYALGRLLRAVDPSDVLVIVGVLLLGRGLYLLAPWSSWVAIGGLLIWYALPPRPPFIVRQKGPDR